MTAHHTPGKWKKEKYRIFANGFAKPEYPIHAEKRGLIAKAFRESDAYLIAASPDLLAALKNLMELLDDEIKTSTNEQLAFGLIDPQCPQHIKSELACVIACRAAIAKSEGKA